MSKIRIPIRFATLALAALLSNTSGCAPKKEQKVVVEEPQSLVEINGVQEYAPIDEDIVIDNVETVYVDEKDNVLPEGVDEEYLVASFFATALKTTSVYEKASSKSKELDLLPEGEGLQLISDLENGWYEVSYDDGSAYVKSDDIEIVESIEAPRQDRIPEITSADEVFLYVNTYAAVKATTTVNIRAGKTTKSKKLGQLTKGQTLKFVKEHDEWYEVIYEGKKAYVFKEYAKIDYGYTMSQEMCDTVHATRKTPIFDIVTGEVIFNMPKREAAEVYAKMGDYYLVNCEGHIGYMPKKYAMSLGDTYAIIDISSQNLKAYDIDKLEVNTPVVTGKDSTPTYCGVFQALEKGEKIYWKEFDVTVDQGIRFSRKKWIHDMKSRKNQFGGTIYHKNGSHGCVNTPKKAMVIVYRILRLGSIVLVKK